MDIKSKNVDENIKRNKFKSFLLNRKLRAFVFAVTCILAAAIYLLTIRYSDLKDSYPYSDDSLFLNNYTESYEFHQEKLSFYEAMCITSSFYLRNTNENYKFQLSDIALNEYIKTMKNDYDLIIENDNRGKLSVDSDFWDFYVAFGDKYITNIENLKINEQPDMEMIPHYLKNKYKNYVLRVYNNAEMSEDYYDSDIYYTEVFNQKGYDVEYADEYSLPVGASGYDNLGRFIFQYYGDGDIKFYDENKKDKKFDNISMYEIRNNIVTSDPDETYYGEISSYIKGYEINIYNDTEISLFFAPKAEQANIINAGFKSIQDKHKQVTLKLIACWMTLIILYVYLAVVCGYNANKKKKWGHSVLFGGWFTEFQIASAILSGAMSATIFFDYSDIRYFIEYFITDNSKTVNLIISITFSLCYALFAGFSLGLISKFKSKMFIQDSLCFRLIMRFIAFAKKHIVNTELFRLFNKKTIGQKLYTITWIFIAFSIVMIFLLFVALASYYTVFPIFYAILCVIYLIYTLWYIITLFKGFSDINTLCRQIEQVSNDEDITDEINEYSIIYNDSQRLLSISENVKENVEKQLKSERMKIELVTNVSHDLKTPLTSIISYIDLLKKEQLSNEAMDYVRILDAKSQKLKNIVSDVFSLAKATSGIDLELEEIDGVILLRQVLGDNEDKISSSGKSIKTEIHCDAAVINADGNKLYRVFQNLIDNALNYSMNGTRIFINLECDSDFMTLTVKNTANYEMNFTPEEITERFTRGDKSRTDGGSGLGLSIAKSFTEACGGLFKIELDGDVFKALVKMPLKKEEIKPEK